MLLGCGCGLELAELAGERPGGLAEDAGLWAVGASPWAALALGCWARHGRTEFDRTWFGFRDRFGLLWGQGIREQFNRAAANAGWPIVLTWQGLGGSKAGGEAAGEALATLRALLKRFGPGEGAAAASPAERGTPGRTGGI